MLIDLVTLIPDCQIVEYILKTSEITTPRARHHTENRRMSLTTRLIEYALNVNVRFIVRLYRFEESYATAG